MHSTYTHLDFAFVHILLLPHFTRYSRFTIQTLLLFHVQSVADKIDLTEPRVAKLSTFLVSL